MAIQWQRRLIGLAVSSALVGGALIAAPVPAQAYEPTSIASVWLTVVGGGQPTVGKKLQVNVKTDNPIPDSRWQWYSWSISWRNTDDQPVPHSGGYIDQPASPWNPYLLYMTNSSSLSTLTIAQDMVDHPIVADVELYYLPDGPNGFAMNQVGGGTTPPITPVASSDDGPVTPVAKIPMSKVTASYMKTLAYNGYQQYPYSATFRYGGKYMSPDDYTIKLGANRKVGKGTFTLIGKGRFTGSKTFSFKIKKMSKSQRTAAAKAEAKRLAKLIKLHTTSKRDQTLIIYMVTLVSKQGFQSNAWYKKNFGNEAYSDFALGVSACSGSTSASILLAQALGIKTKHVNANKWTHQWAMFKVTSTQWWKVDTWLLPLNMHGYWPKWITTDSMGKYVSDASILLRFPMNLVFPSNWYHGTPS